MQRNATWLRCWLQSGYLLPVVVLLLAQGLAGVQGQTTEAAVATGKVSTITSSWLDALWADHLVARAAVVTGQPVLAEAFYRDALRVDPDSTNIVMQSARFYHARKLSPMHRMMASIGYVLDPSSDEWTGWLGEIKPGNDSELSAEDDKLHRKAAELFKQGNHMEAELLLRRLLSRRPESRRLVVDLGILYTQTADWTMSAAAFAYLARLFPGDFDAANNLSVSLDKMGRPDLVFNVLQDAAESRPGDPYLQKNLAVYAGLTGQPEKSLQYAKAWVETAPENPEAHIFLGRRLLATGQVEQADSQAEVALKLTPGQADAIALKAEVLISKGNMDNALDRLKALRDLIGDVEFEALAHREPYRRVPGIGDLMNSPGGAEQESP